MSYNNKPERPAVRQLDIDRIQMFTPAPGSDGERSSLNWQLTDFGTGYGFNPRITVWTRVPTDPEKRPIDAPLNSFSLEHLVQLLEETCVGEPGHQSSITCEVPNKDENGKRMQGNKIISRVVVGKDKEGRVWIAVLSENPDRPKLRFIFTTGLFHRLLHKDGTPYSEAEESVIGARSTIRILRTVLDKYPPIITEEAKAQQKEARESRTGGNGRAPQRPAVSDFEDITL